MRPRVRPEKTPARRTRTMMITMYYAKRGSSGLTWTCFVPNLKWVSDVDGEVIGMSRLLVAL